MELMTRYAHSEGLKCIEGQILQENSTMIQMCREFGFEIGHDPEDESVRRATLQLE
jgi:acetyltransferase